VGRANERVTLPFSEIGGVDLVAIRQIILPFVPNGFHHPIVQALKLTFIEITLLVQANSKLSSAHLKNVSNQLNTPFIIMGEITPYGILKQHRQKT